MFHRVLFFDQKGQYSFEVALHLSDCYDILSDHQKSQYFLDMAYHLTSDDSVQNEILFMKTWKYVKHEEYEQGLKELFSADLNSPYFTSKYQFYSGMIYFLKKDYERSADFLFKFTKNEASREELKLLFEKVQKINRRYNPKMATALSLVIPGLGQLYCGDVKNSLNSFLLTGMFGYLFIHTAVRYSFSDAFVSVMPWYQRYFMGGYERAGKIAMMKREMETDEVLHKILEVIAPPQIP